MRVGAKLPNSGSLPVELGIPRMAGALEASVILTKDGDRFDAGSRLWRRMWGESHLSYLVDSGVLRHSDDELRSLVDAR
mgnify:CR=1 FL=1